MDLLPPSMLKALALAISLALPAFALEIRSYSAALNDRLIQFPGAPVYNQTPAVNPTFPPSAALFLGVGWPAHPTDWTRQMALVSPSHLVCATHYPLGADWKIAFLGIDGNQHTYRIKSQVPIVNALGQTTDLMLCTLKTEIPTSLGIKPFPVLNLPSEADYVGKSMVVCGSFVRAGKMPLAGFTHLSNDPGFDTTRFAYFDYNKIRGASDSCNFQGGDSGSPTFIVVNGKAAIIGTASGQDQLPNNISRNYLNFIPHYLPELDTLMESQGYHITRFYPEATSLQTRITSSGTLLKLKSAAANLETLNLGTKAAHNVTLQLTFSSAPDKIEGAGWICKATSPLIWNCRRGGIAGSGQANLTASWKRLPNVGSIQISGEYFSDGGKARMVTTKLPLL